MDASQIARSRMEEVRAEYSANVQYARDLVSARLAQIQSPNDRFAQILGETMQAGDEAVRYTYATPENLAQMRAVTTERTVQTTAKTTSQVVADWPEYLLESREKYDPLVQEAAVKYGLSADLIHAVIRAESTYNPNNVSSAGAQGLMQLMPATAAEVGVTDPFDPAQNIDGATQYLRKMLDRFDGDLRLALAAYNCGPNRVSSLGITSSADAEAYSRLSDGVRTYVSRVLGYAGIE